MYEGEYSQLHRSDRQRLIDWVNQEAWKFEPPSRGRWPRKRRRARGSNRPEGPAAGN